MRVLGLALLLAASPLSAQQKPDPVGQQLIACSPVEYTAALACLDRHLPDASKTELREKGGVPAHFGLGMFIRNNWGLWKGGPLQASMKRAGFIHPDDMSAAIIDGYVAQLRGEQFDLDAAAASYRAYWNRAKKSEDNNAD